MTPKPFPPPPYIAETPMPRLSESLAGVRDPRHCQSCGGAADLSAWQECDDHDCREPIALILCGRCAALLIEPHPRLYHPLQLHEPFPGIMPICVACAHRVGVRCLHPLSESSGGPGVTLTFPAQTVGMLDYRDKAGRRRCRPFVLFTGPVTDCSGRTTQE